MTGFELLLLILLIVSVVLALVGGVTRDGRWSSFALSALSLVFLCQLVNSL